MIYLDNAATTMIDPVVLEAMLPYLTEQYGNAGTLYKLGRNAASAVQNARSQVARMFSCKEDNIIFTSGGSEGNNTVFKGVAAKLKEAGKLHIVVSAIEHDSVLRAAESIIKDGFYITYVKPDAEGCITFEAVEKAITPATGLVSVMFANNEIGTIQPIEKIGEIAKKHGVLFHTDGVQAYGQLPVDVDKCHIDMFSASGHKLNGPKGIGFLYIRKGIKIRSFVHGGQQERARRAGTENVPAIVGMGAAARRAFRILDEKTKKETELRDYLIERIEAEIPYCRLNGDRTCRLPNNVNFSFRFIEGESLLIMLDMEGICASSGSACTSGSLDPSHVLLAIGLPHEIAHGSLRLTLSEETTRDEIDTVVEAIKKIVNRLRAMSPLYEDFVKKNQ